MEIYVVVNKGKGVRAFHNWVDALELVSEHNNKVGRCAQFEFADKEMFDALMDERLQNVWTDTGFYEPPSRFLFSAFVAFPACRCYISQSFVWTFRRCPTIFFVWKILSI